MISVDFIYFDAGATDPEKQLLTVAFQSKETLRKKEELYSSSGWDMCLLVANLHQMDKDSGVDAESVESGVESWLIQNVDFAQSLNHRVKTGNEVAHISTMIHQRITQAVD